MDGKDNLVSWRLTSCGVRSNFVRIRLLGSLWSLPMWTTWPLVLFLTRCRRTPGTSSNLWPARKTARRCWSTKPRVKKTINKSEQHWIHCNTPEGPWASVTQVLTYPWQYTQYSASKPRNTQRTQLGTHKNMTQFCVSKWSIVQSKLSVLTAHTQTHTHTKETSKAQL